MRALNRQRIPLGLKIGYSLWMVYWVSVVFATLGPPNFFWLCNIAMFILLWAIWREEALSLSSQAGTVTVVGVVWTLDISVAVLMGGNSPTGITSYVFDERLALIARLTSLYHVALPVLAVWLCRRIGYDRRGLLLQCVIGTVGILGARLLTHPDRNINYAHGAAIAAPEWMPEAAFLALLLFATMAFIFVPGHWLLKRIAPAAR